ncbi:MAG: hypothetical protein GY950_32920 [bacterium]|nr:hypothetical protein [bacterium]
MSVLLSGVVVNVLAGLAADLLKKIGKGMEELIKKDETKTILNQAFSDFKENAFKQNGAKDEKILLRAFEEFFTDDRTVGELRLVFGGQSRKVDFNLMEEIFVRICVEKGIEIPTFNFFLALSRVIEGIEQLSRKSADLDRIVTLLQKPGRETNLTFARFKYLHQLIRHNNRLQFTGIPDPREKKDIEIPDIFVMPRARIQPGPDPFFLLTIHFPVLQTPSFPLQTQSLALQSLSLALHSLFPALQSLFPVLQSLFPPLQTLCLPLQTLFPSLQTIFPGLHSMIFRLHSVFFPLHPLY